MSPKVVDFGVPARALPAWTELHAQIARTGPTPCAGEDRDLFTGTSTEQHLAAGHCLDCPVMVACGRYAAIAGETGGVWGGLTAQQRARKEHHT